MGEVIDALPNYTGPYISNGEFQTSVEFGDKPPKDKLDALSRLHDSAYAHFDDYGHRRAADVIYGNEAKQLVGLFPELAGLVVKYGNQIGDSFSTILSSYGMLGPAGILVGGVKNALKLHDYMINEQRYKKDITEYYATDPVDFARIKNVKQDVPELIQRIKRDKFDTLDEGFGEQILPNNTAFEIIQQSTNNVFPSIPVPPKVPEVETIFQKGLFDHDNFNTDIHGVTYNPYYKFKNMKFGRRRRKLKKNKIFIQW